MEPRIKDRGKVFRDPVHRLIRIEPGDGFILELIDTPVFQRLRRIRQLGVSWLTYHGAEHSRFSHSMGVFNFAQRILRSLQGRYKQNSSVVDYLESHAKELKAAALLHDIGHAPFSHLLERAFEGGPDHEQKTTDLIRNPASSIPSILSEAGIAPERVADIIEMTSEDRLIVDIVSSQLDADKMDYLLRDSLHTGVEYGRYDCEWVVRNLCIGQDPNASVSNIGENAYSRHRLCLDRDRGLHSAEQLILARLHMTMQVYMHRVTRGYEVLLLNLLQLAAELASNGRLPDGTPDVVRSYFENKGMLPAEEWLLFDEPAMFTAFAVWSRTAGEDCNELRRMSSALLRRERLFRARWIDRRRLGMAGERRLFRKLEDVGRQGIDWQFDEGRPTAYTGLLSSAGTRKKDAEEQSAESILLASGDLREQAVQVEAKSRILQTLDIKGPEEVCRIYYDRDKASRIEPILDEAGVSEER
jgi:HD superfamily phosphohydrolase